MTKLTSGTPVTALITPGMDDTNPWATHDNRWGRGGVKFVATNKGRDLIPLGRRFESVAIVKSSDGGLTKAFMWSGLNEDGTDGKWEEFTFPGSLIVADTDGAIPTGRHTMVFGPDFDIEAAGDQGAGVLIKLAAGAKGGGDGLIAVGTYGKDDTFSKGNRLEFEFPLEAFADPDKDKAVRVTMQHGLYKPAGAPNYLAYVDFPEEVIGNVKGDMGHHTGALWCGDVVVGAGPYIQIDKVNKAIGLQEADDKDPNVSGGMNYLVAIVGAPQGIASEAGTIRQYWYDKTTGGYAKDINGHPLATEVDYKQGDKLMPKGNPLLTVGILNEKGMHMLAHHVEDSFDGDTVVLGTRTNGPTGIMIQALTPDSKTGDALQQFELDTGITLPCRVAWMGADRASIGWLVSQSMPMKWGAAGTGQKMNDGWDFHNLTVAMIGIENGHLVVTDATANEADAFIPGKPKEICDFYFAKIFDNEETQMMRGHETEIDTAITAHRNGFNFDMVVWTGEPNKYGRVFDKRVNGSPVLNKGWRIVDSAFAAESMGAVDTAISKAVTVPAEATNFGWLVTPSSAQSPMELMLKKMDVDVPNPFTGAIIKKPIFPDEKALEFDERKKRFVQDNRGFAGLRYTLTNHPTPMPVGFAGKGLADITIDPSVNKVIGSDANGGEGAYLFGKDGSAFLETGWYLYPGEKLAKGVRANVRFWASTVSADGQSFTKIDDSETEVQVTGGGLPKYVAMNHFREEVEKGNRIALFGQTDNPDDAYVFCDTPSKPIVETDITFTELVAVP